MTSLAYDLDQPTGDLVLADLRADLDGRLVLPGDADWEEARAAWNLAVDQRPAAVVVAGSTLDLARTVRAARLLGLRVAPQATGHNAAPLAAHDGLAHTILLRTSELRGVEVRPRQRIARVEPGALWGDVVAAATPHGLAALAGSSHDVGVVGYTLGGGVSWLARSHGLAANHVVAIELVTADGEFHRVDAEHEPELFWALRGGGGAFGVVTALEFDLFAIDEVVAGTLFWPIERTREVLAAWADWTTALPDTVTSIGRVLRMPDLPELPPFLAGRAFVVVEATLLETGERADELLAPLRALAPEMDTVHPQSPADLLQLHMDPPGPVPGIGDGMMLETLPQAAVRAFADAVGPDADTVLLSAEIRHLGGGLRPDAAAAAAREDDRPAPGAVAGFDAEYLVFGVGMAIPGMVDALHASIGRLLARVEPWRAGTEYQNFAERRLPASRFHGEGALARLRALKDAVDPDGLIRANHTLER